MKSVVEIASKPVLVLKVPTVHKLKVATVFILHEYTTEHKVGSITKGFSVKIPGAADPLYT